MDLMIINRLLDEIKELNAKMVEHEKEKRLEDPYQSPQINELVAALSKAQGSYPPICSDRQGFNFRYADLDMILLSIRPHLEKNGLSVTQYTKDTAKEGITMYTRVYHSSGQWMETRARVLPEKTGLQAYGSAMTYTRRYQMNAILGVSVDKDKTDDDGQPKTSDDIKEVRETPKEVYELKNRSFETISPDELANIEYELVGFPKIEEQLKETFRLTSLADIPKSHYRTVLNKLMVIKDELKRARK